MLEHHDHVEIARITARQAIFVALISAAAGVATTLIGTARLNDSSRDSVNATIEALKKQVTSLSKHNAQLQSQLESPTVTAKPPNLSHVVDTYDLALAVCSDRAGRTLSSIGATTIGHTDNSAYGFASDYTVAIACFPRSKAVDFAVAGPVPSTIDDLITRAQSEFRRQ